MKVENLVIILLLALLFIRLQQAEAYEESARLFNHFFDGSGYYNSRLRPVKDARRAVTIRISVGLRQIIRLEDQTQVLSASVWIRNYWRDELLTWDPSEFNGTSELLVPHELVWRPDLVLYSSVASVYAPSVAHNVLRVNHTGDVLYMFPATVEVSCPLNVTYFPFDEQLCPLLFGSWAYDGKKMDLLANEDNDVDIGVFQRNNEWDLINVTVARTEEVYSCCKDTFYPSIAYNIRLRRRSESLFFYMIVPMILIQCLALMQFLLPCDSGEKVTLGITVYLTVIVYLLMVHEMLPNSDSIPLIVRFIVGTMCLIAISQIAAVFVLCLHHNGNHDNHGMVPHWARVVFLHGVAGCLGMARYITNDDEHVSKLLATSDAAIEVIPEEREEEAWSLQDKKSVSQQNSAAQIVKDGHSARDASTRTRDDSTERGTIFTLGPVDMVEEGGSVNTDMVFPTPSNNMDNLPIESLGGDQALSPEMQHMKSPVLKETSASVNSLHSFPMESRGSPNPNTDKHTAASGDVEEESPPAPTADQEQDSRDDTGLHGGSVPHSHVAACVVDEALAAAADQLQQLHQDHNMERHGGTECQPYVSNASLFDESIPENSVAKSSHHMCQRMSAVSVNSAQAGHTSLHRRRSISPRSSMDTSLSILPVHSAMSPHTPADRQRLDGLHHTANHSNSQHGNSQHSNSHHSNSQHSNSHHSNSHHSNSHHSNSHHSNSQHGNSQHGNSHHSNSQHNSSQLSNSQNINSQYSNSQHASSQHSNSQHFNDYHSNSQHSSSQYVSSHHSNNPHSNSQHSNRLHASSQHSNSQHVNDHHSNSEYVNSQHSNSQHSSSQSSDSHNINSQYSNNQPNNDHHSNSQHSTSPHSNNQFTNDINSHHSNCHFENGSHSSGYLAESNYNNSNHNNNNTSNHTSSRNPEILALKPQLRSKSAYVCRADLEVGDEDNKAGNKGGGGVLGAVTTRIHDIMSRFKENKVTPEEDVNSLAHRKFTEFGQKRSDSFLHYGADKKKQLVRESELRKDGSMLLYKIYKYCENHHDRTLDSDRDAEVRCEWQQVAMVLDRLMFFIYFLVSLCLYLWFFLQIPAY